jgi:Outer membrane protein beta-barrel domain
VRSLVFGAIAILLALPASAQTQRRFHPDAPHTGAVEVEAAALWTGGYDAGTSPANLTRNPSTGTAPLELFQTSSRLSSSPGGEVRLGVYLTPRFSVEGGVAYSRPNLETKASGDFESAPDATLSVSVAEYLIDASAVYQVASIGGDRGGPFVSGGGGYLRQLYDGNVNLQTGSEFHGGGGLRYWLSEGRRRIGVRIEGRASVRTHSIDPEQQQKKRRVLPVFSAGVLFVF